MDVCGRAGVADTAVVKCCKYGRRLLLSVSKNGILLSALLRNSTLLHDRATDFNVCYSSVVGFACWDTDGHPRGHFPLS